MSKFIKYWLPAIIWMSLIFYFSSKQNVSVSTTFTLNFIILKASHMIGYAVLYFLLFRALYSTKHKKKIDESLMQAALFAVLYSASDELHQLFVPTRSGHLEDIMIDSIGIFIMYTYLKYNFKRLKIFIL